MKRLLLVSALLLGCGGELPDRLDKAPDMEAAILRLAPLGTALPEAVRRLSAEGFRCEAVQRGSFAGVADSFNYSYCNASSIRGAIESRYWQLALADSGGKLSRVYVSVATVMP